MEKQEQDPELPPGKMDIDPENMEAQEKRENDLKKIYQTLSETCKQLEHLSSKCSSVEALFGVELMSRRNTVKELCEKLMLEAPKKFGVTARDKLWRSVYYDVVSRVKRIKRLQNLEPVERAILQMHLTQGVGNLNLLLRKVLELDEFEECKFEVGLAGSGILIPVNVCTEGKNDPEKWMVNLLYPSILHIGDLNRYMSEVFFQNDDMYARYFDRAQQTYTNAFFLNPDSGMAHNQLGNLCVKLNYGLDSTYYLLYCLVSANPYELAFANLKQLIDGKLAEIATLPASECKTLQIFIQSYLSMIYHVLRDVSYLKNFEKSCQEAIGNFVEVICDVETKEQSDILMKVSLISVMTVWRLQKMDSPNVSVAVAFACGLFTNLMLRISDILMEHTIQKPKILKINNTVEEVTISTDELPTSPISPEPDQNEDLSITEIKVSKRNKPFARRRRRRQGPASSDFLACFSSDDDDSSGSEGEEDHENGLNTSSEYDYSDSDKWDSSSDESYNSSTEEESDNEGENKIKLCDSSEVSELSYQAELELDKKAAALKLSQEKERKCTNPDDTLIAEEMVTVIEIEDLKECWDEVEPLLVAILPLMRWLQVTPAVQSAFAVNCEKSLLEKFCKVFNLLEAINWGEASETCPVDGEENIEISLLKKWNNILEDQIDPTHDFGYQLSEDNSMLGLPSFSELIYPLKKVSTFSDLSAMIIRAGRVVLFGHWLVGTESFPVIRSKNSFLVPSVEEFKKHMRKIQLEKFKRPLTRKQEASLLGELYEAEFGKISASTNGRGNRNRNRDRKRSMDFLGKKIFEVNERDRVYLVVDLLGFLKKFRIVRKLAMHPKFNLVVPHKVHEALDYLKDTQEEGSKVARIAIKWFEICRKKNYPAIRILRGHEKCQIDAEYPSHHNKESLEFFDSLECCKFLKKNMFQENIKRPTRKFFHDVRDNYRIFYFTGHKDLFNSSTDFERDYNPIQLARSTNVFFDKIHRYQNRNRKSKQTSFENQDG